MINKKKYAGIATAAAAIALILCEIIGSV